MQDLQLEVFEMEISFIQSQKLENEKTWWIVIKACHFVQKKIEKLIMISAETKITFTQSAP